MIPFGKLHIYNMRITHIFGMQSFVVMTVMIIDTQPFFAYEWRFASGGRCVRGPPKGIDWLHFAIYHSHLPCLQCTRYIRGTPPQCSYILKFSLSDALFSFLPLHFADTLSCLYPGSGSDDPLPADRPEPRAPWAELRGLNSRSISGENIILDFFFDTTAYCVRRRRQMAPLPANLCNEHFAVVSGCLSSNAHTLLSTIAAPVDRRLHFPFLWEIEPFPFLSSSVVLAVPCP